MTSDTRDPLALLLRTEFEAKRIEETISKTNIGQPWLFEIDAEGEVIELRAEGAIVLRNASREQRNLKSERPQQRGEGSIEFVAETAAIFVYDFVQNASLVAEDFAVQMDVEIFEGNGEEVGTMEGAKKIYAGMDCFGSRIADALEIGFNVHGDSLRRGNPRLHRQFFLHPSTGGFRLGLACEIQNQLFEDQAFAGRIRAQRQIGFRDQAN